MRIMSSYFFKGDCSNSIIFSNKLSRESKNLHYQGLEELKTTLKNLSIEGKWMKMTDMIFDWQLIFWYYWFWLEG